MHILSCLSERPNAGDDATTQTVRVVSNNQLWCPLTHHDFSLPRATKSTTVLASSQDLDEIDPMTGEVITGSAKAKVAGESLTTQSGLKIAYRRAEVPSDATETVVCIHGLGSTSFSYRNSLSLLAGAGFDAIAFDFPGHGDSDHPDVSKFDYSVDAYMDEMDAIIKALPKSGGRSTVSLIVHGYVLGQAAILYACRHPEVVDRVVSLNVPFGKKAKLRPELAAYKNPIAFMKPKLGGY